MLKNEHVAGKIPVDKFYSILFSEAFYTKISVVSSFLMKLQVCKVGVFRQNYMGKYENTVHDNASDQANLILLIYKRRAEFFVTHYLSYYPTDFNEILQDFGLHHADGF